MCPRGPTTEWSHLPHLIHRRRGRSDGGEDDHLGSNHNSRYVLHRKAKAGRRQRGPIPRHGRRVGVRRTRGVPVRDQGLGPRHAGLGRVEGPGHPVGARANPRGSEGDVGGSLGGVVGPVEVRVEHGEVVAGGVLFVVL